MVSFNILNYCFMFFTDFCIPVFVLALLITSKVSILKCIFYFPLIERVDSCFCC